MKREDFLRRIEELTKDTNRKREDPRFKNIMGFLLAKGLLGYNRPLRKTPNARIPIVDALWAGRNIEPRILEVLPAAIARLPGHFVKNARPGPEETRILEAAARLAKGEEGPEIFGIPYAKYRIWMDLPLKDLRTKLPTEKKRLKTFRLSADSISLLKLAANREKRTEVEILQRLIGSLKSDSSAG
jgi:hypothetical protein